MKFLYLDFIFALGLFIYNYYNKTIGPIELLGLLIGIPGYLLWIKTRVDLGKSFSTLPKAKGLVTTGFYSKVRNPIYVFSTLTYFGAILPSRNILQYILLIALILMQLYRSTKEATVLEKEYGQKYRDYKKTTWF